MKNECGTIDLPIARSKIDRKKMAVDANGKRAITEWNVMKYIGSDTLLDVHILTGRTHQIRVHMAYSGHPVLGDPIYGIRDKAKRLMLHAYSLRFCHPRTGQEMFFYVPCPFAPDEMEEK